MVAFCGSSLTYDWRKTKKTKELRYLLNSKQTQALVNETKKNTTGFYTEVNPFFHCML